MRGTDLSLHRTGVPAMHGRQLNTAPNQMLPSALQTVKRQILPVSALGGYLLTTAGRDGAAVTSRIINSSGAGLPPTRGACLGLYLIWSYCELE